MTESLLASVIKATESVSGAQQQLSAVAHQSSLLKTLDGILTAQQKKCAISNGGGSHMVNQSFSAATTMPCHNNSTFFDDIERHPQLPMLSSCLQHPVPFTNGQAIDWTVPPGAADAFVSDNQRMQWQLAAGGQFTSLVCSASVARGRWMFEATLSSDGLFQIGWCGPLMLFPWTPRLGVGDFPFSVGFDGHRQQLWNVQSSSCGYRWAQGDVITCCLDLEGCSDEGGDSAGQEHKKEAVASFYQNGVFVGSKPLLTVANASQRAEELSRTLLNSGGSSMDGVAAAAGHHFVVPANETAMSFSPALSLGQFESCVVNLGAMPFRYPVAGFQPMDMLGSHTAALWNARAPLLMEVNLQPHQDTLLVSLIRQLRAASSSSSSSNANTAANNATNDDDISNTEAVEYHWSGFIYMMYRVFLSYVERDTNSNSCKRVIALLHQLELFLTADEYHLFVQSIAALCAHHASIARLASSNVHQWHPSSDLLLLRTCVSKCPSFRQAWTRSPNFQTDFLNVFRIKTPNNYDLSHIIFPGTTKTTTTTTTTTTTNSSSSNAPKTTKISSREANEDYEERSSALFDCVIAVDDHRRRGLLNALLDCPDSQVAVLTTVSDIITELRKIMVRNAQTNPQNVPPSQSARPRCSAMCVDSPLVARLFFSLVCYIADVADSLRVRHHHPSSSSSSSSGQQQQTSSSSSSSMAYSKALCDTFCPPELLLQSSLECVDISRIGGTYQSVTKQHGDALREDIKAHRALRSLDALPPTHSLLFKTVMLYCASVKDLVISACADFLLRYRQREALRMHSQLLKQNSPQTSPEIVERLLEDMMLSGRNCAWSMATIFHMRTHDMTSKFCSVVVDMIRFYEPTPWYYLMPIIVIECFVDVWHFSRKSAPNYAQLVRQYPENIVFFVDRLLDVRIAHVETNEYLILSLSGVMDTIEAHRQAVVEVLERHQDALLVCFKRVLEQFVHPHGWTLAVCLWTRLNVGNNFCLVDLEDESSEWNSCFPTRRNLVLGSPTLHPRSYDVVLDHVRNEDGGAEMNAAATAEQHHHVVVAAAAAATLPPDDGTRERTEEEEQIKEEEDNSSIWRRPPKAFEFYRRFFATQFLADGPTARKFFKTLITHCNWCVSELGVSVHSLLHQQPSALPTEKAAARRRCMAIFELTRKLLHVFEFTIDAGRRTYFVVGGAACNSVAERTQNIAFVLELWTQTLTRFCSRSNDLTRLIHENLLGLEKLYQWKMMAPVVGMLCAMLEGGSNLSLESNGFLKCLVERQFVWPLDAVKHILYGVDWHRLNMNLPWDKAAVFLSPALEVLQHLEALHAKANHHTRLADDDSGQVEEGICTICVCNAADTIFAPCGHTSCLDCINRQMMMSGRCFYCNTTVTGLRHAEQHQQEDDKTKSTNGGDEKR